MDNDFYECGRDCLDCPSFEDCQMIDEENICPHNEDCDNCGAFIDGICSYYDREQDFKDVVDALNLDSLLD